MGYIVLNNAKATLAGAVSIGATSLSVASGKGALFAVGTDYTYITLEDTAGNVDHVKLTARSGDTLTISATTRAFSIGDVVECRPCREAVNDLIASQITAATGKTTPVDADTLGLVDSAASNVLKKLTWANLNATLKTYFDTLYAALSGFTLTGGLIFKAGLNNIASAATVNLTALGANTAHITGTTGISAFTMTSGQVVDLVFDGALLLTHHATTNNLPGGTSFTTQAGDRATYWYDGTTVRCMAYQRVNSSPLYGVLTPAQITADQNDYSPSGIVGVSMVRLWSDAARNITGLAAWNDAARTIFLHNAGNYAITLKDESASSQTYNRFALTADLVLQPDQVALLQYDASSSRWRNVGGGGATSEAYIYIRDEQSSGTHGGTFTSGSWVKRTLNTEVNDAGGHATLASSVITLAAGTYRFRARAPAWSVHSHQVRLANTSDSTYIYGSSCLASAGASHQGDSVVVGRFTIATSKNFELQHRCGMTANTYGLGNACGFGNTEVYAEIEFWKES